MMTHSQLAARLLRDAESFVRTIAGQNRRLHEQMEENAKVYEQVAALVEHDPSGTIEA